MYHSDIEIKEGAFFVSDVHYSSIRPEFLSFLYAIKEKKLLPTQLFLMGDIFDALFGGVEKTLQKNEDAIATINAIASEIEVIYLEGNHDFNLQTTFPSLHVFSIKQQPLRVSYKSATVLLAHGDFDGKLGYRIYTSIIRNKLVLKFLNLFDSYILEKLDRHLAKKDDCKELGWFEDFIQKRMPSMDKCAYFIEGHFHQNKQYKVGDMNYINLGAFACNQRYFIVKSTQDKELLEENIFSKET